MSDSEYGFATTLSGVAFEDATRLVSDALASEGFGILTEIDVQATFKKKIGIDFRPYVILGACNPLLAKQALEAEPQIGLLLPCNVVVQEGPGDQVIVSIVNPKTMFTLVDNPHVAGIAEEIERRLRRAMRRLPTRNRGSA